MDHHQHFALGGCAGISCTLGGEGIGSTPLPIPVHERVVADTPRTTANGISLVKDLQRVKDVPPEF